MPSARLATKRYRKSVKMPSVLPAATPSFSSL
jgi:hypothetical protein